MSAEALIDVDLRIARLREESLNKMSEAIGLELEQLLQERQKLIRQMVGERTSSESSDQFFSS